MNAPRPNPQPSGDDAVLRQALRDSLTAAPRERLGSLEERAMAQWQQLQRHHALPRGPLAALPLRWRQHPAWLASGLLALAFVAVLASRSWAPADNGIDELMQPDVLSLISMGEL